MLDVAEMWTPSEKQAWSPIAIFGSKPWDRYDVTASSQRFRSTKIPLPNEMFLPPIIRHPGPRRKPGASSERLIIKLLILVRDRLAISSIAMQNGLARKGRKWLSPSYWQASVGRLHSIKPQSLGA